MIEGKRKERKGRGIHLPGWICRQKKKNVEKQSVKFIAIIQIQTVCISNADPLGSLALRRTWTIYLHQCKTKGTIGLLIQ